MIWLFYVALITIICSSLYIYITLTVSHGSAYRDNSIDAFIISGDYTAPVIKRDAYDRYKRDHVTEGKQVLVLYGTEYGCSEEIARLLYDRITDLNLDNESHPFQPRVINMKDFNVLDFTKEQALFIIVSTSGDGVPPSDAKACYDFFLEQDTNNISHLKISLLALGDSNYPQFCKTGRTLHQRLVQSGCETVVKQEDVDMEDWSVINRWIDAVLLYLKQADLSVQMDYIQHDCIVDDSYSRNRPFMATLKTKYLLTVSDEADGKETIHCEFDLTSSDLIWTSGDALGIYPQNSTEEVDRLLQAMKCDGDETCDIPSWAYHTEGCDSQKSMCASMVLQKYYDLKHVKRELLQILHENIQNEDEKLKWDKLLDKESYIGVREVADVLLDCPSHTLTCKQILGCLKSLPARYYSISSSPLIDKNTACVTAAVVRYKMLGRNRTGVTTTYLQDRLAIGQKCPVFISRNIDFRLPVKETVPLIMIGPGTGIAPFISFIQERVLTPKSAKMLLYFGCRHIDKDYLYRPMLESWANENKIILNVAFSRHQTEKVYVQHLLYRDKEVIWQLIDKENASIYVCGDARSMASDVNSTLIRIVSDLGQKSENKAKRYIQTLENDHRYQKDVWVV